MRIQSETLAEGLPREINRVREIQKTYEQLRGIPNVMVEPTIAMMEADIQAAIQATAQQDTVAMLRAYQSLSEYDA